jgi:hypothetical protein
LDFLANQGFDFNKFIYEGVPLLRASDRDRHLARVDAEDSTPPRPNIPLDKAENRELVDKLVAQVTEWLKARPLSHAPKGQTETLKSQHARVLGALNMEQGLIPPVRIAALLSA